MIRDLPIFRPKDVVERWAQHDPIKVYSERLMEKGILQPEDMIALTEEVDTEMKNAIAYGMESPRPDVEVFLEKIRERYAL